MVVEHSLVQLDSSEVEVGKTNCELRGQELKTSCFKISFCDIQISVSKNNHEN
jgi:hypothetical protein